MIATASERNHDFVRELEAEPLDYADDDVPGRVHDLLDDSGADAALDLFSGDVREQAFAALRQGGRLASVAQPPPEAREGHEGAYLFVRPSGFDLGEHIRRWWPRAACARPSRTRSRSNGRPTRTSGSRRATYAASWSLASADAA